jgi:hypothetical protein
MSLAPTDGVPLQIEAGNSASFLLSYGDFPPASYSLAFVLSQGTAAPVSVNATDAGNGKFLVTLTTTITAALTPGNCSWIAYASATNTRATAESGTITVLPNLAVAQTPSYAQTMVTALQTALTAFASTDKRIVDFNGQRFERAHMADYQKQHTYWKAIVVSEQAALARSLGGKDPTRVTTVFVPASGVTFPFGYPPSSP